MANPKNTQNTKSSVSQIAQTRTIRKKRLTEDELLNTAGSSGTYIVNGFLESDYNANLAGVAGLEKYDEMRKSDSKIRQSLMVCMLPILSTEWYIEAATDPDTGEVGEPEEEVEEFVEKALFEKMKTPWQVHLTEVLTMLPMGFSLFEKTYTADEFDDHVWIDDLGFRKQTTIQKWETDLGEPGVTQQLPTTIQDPYHPNFGQNKVDIPSGKMLLFSYQKEGDNYAGVSVLRSAYRHWYIKDALYKFDSIKHERQGVGVPLIKLPKGYTEKDKAEAKLILKNVRANELGGIVLPDGWEFLFADLQAGNTTDIWKSIEHHNAEIANNVLAMFLNLVSGDGGSRALSEDQSDFFLLSLEALANLIEDVYNRFLIPELVDFNYEVTSYPKLRHRKLGNVGYGEMANTLSTLVSSGVINPDEDLEDWSRKLIDAPPRQPEPEPVLDENGNEIDPVTGLPIDNGGIDPATGLPIDPTLPPDDQTALDDANVVDDALVAASEVTEIGGVTFFSDGEEWYSAEIEYGGWDGYEFTEKVQSFRIVSEETKKKISEALKKALPGDVEQTKQRLKSEAVTRKATRHAQALQNARARQLARKGKGKTGGVIAQRRAARLKKAGIKDTAARQAKNKLGAQQATNQTDGKKKKTTKVGSALKKIALQQKMKKPKKARKAKLAKGSKKPKKVKVAKAPTVKPAAKPTAPASAQRLAQQKNDPHSPLNKKPVSAAPKKSATIAKPVKPASKLSKSVAARKAKRVSALGKKKVNASEYEEIFAEGARAILNIQRTVEFRKGALPQGAQFFSENAYNSYRPLTFAEQKVNWKSLRKTVSKFETALSSEVDQVTRDQKADLLAQVKRAVDGNDIAAVGIIRAKYTGDLSAALTNVQKEMFEAGKSSVALEMGVNAPGTASEVLGAMRVSNAKLVDKLSSDMEHAAADAVTQVVIKKGGSISGTGTAEAVAAASDAIDKVLDAKAKLTTVTLYGSLNLGRASIFERYPEKVYAFQYSAIIDEKTTDTCLSLDGRVVKAGSGDFYSYNPPLHYNCRSIWVEILEDEEFKPETGDIPSRISSNATIDMFEDLKAPVIEAGSPAMKVLRAEIEERQGKVDDYKESGLYQDRIASHQSRIDDLKKSLGEE